MMKRRKKSLPGESGRKKDRNRDKSIAATDGLDRTLRHLVLMMMIRKHNTRGVDAATELFSFHKTYKPGQTKSV